MDHYLDIQVLPDPEFPPSVLLNALYAKLHRALVSSGRRDIGVSFPNYRAPETVPEAEVGSKPPKKTHGSLGKTLRLHSTEHALSEFMAINWLQGMRDHLAVKGIEPVPAKVEHRVMQRKQAQSNSQRVRQRLIRRLAQREGISEAEASSKLPATLPEKLLPWPFLSLKSQSTGQAFRLFLELSPPQEQASDGKFNAYGLSQTATVPWF